MSAVVYSQRMDALLVQLRARGVFNLPSLPPPRNERDDYFGTWSDERDESDGGDESKYYETFLRECTPQNFHPSKVRLSRVFAKFVDDGYYSPLEVASLLSPFCRVNWLAAQLEKYDVLQSIGDVRCVHFIEAGPSSNDLSWSAAPLLAHTLRTERDIRVQRLQSTPAAGNLETEDRQSTPAADNLGTEDRKTDILSKLDQARAAYVDHGVGGVESIVALAKERNERGKVVAVELLSLPHSFDKSNLPKAKVHISKFVDSGGSITELMASLNALLREQTEQVTNI